MYRNSYNQSPSWFGPIPNLPDYYFLDIPKPILMKQDVSGLTPFFVFAEGLGKKARQRFLLSFNGFDDFEGELYEVKAVREFVRKIIEAKPHFYYYLQDLAQFSSAVFVSACLGDVVAIKQGTLRMGEPHPTLVRLDDDLIAHIQSGLAAYGRSIGEHKTVIDEIIRSRPEFTRFTK
jgi:hypothetical protein